VESLASTSILLVEDDDDSRELLELGLARFGTLVSTASTAEDALALLADVERRRPDALICNLALPGVVDGTQLLGLVRASPGLADIVAIALSGRAAPPDREASLAAGFHEHLSKPAKLGDILAALGRWLPARAT
jgi:CheY-like chemotaxis protein